MESYIKMLTKKELKAISIDQVYSNIIAPFEVMAADNITGKKSTYFIQVREMITLIPDLKIGSFNDNVWYRPNSMLKKETAKRYKSTPQMTKAITLCLASCGQNVIGFYLPTN